MAFVSAPRVEVYFRVKTKQNKMVIIYMYIYRNIFCKTKTRRRLTCPLNMSCVSCRLLSMFSSMERTAKQAVVNFINRQMCENNLSAHSPCRRSIHILKESKIFELFLQALLSLPGDLLK